MTANALQEMSKGATSQDFHRMKVKDNGRVWDVLRKLIGKAGQSAFATGYTSEDWLCC